jgi:malonyl-CoA O-methyltransferase
MMTYKTEICNAFNAHALSYAKAARVQHEIGERLMERLDYLMIKPRFVLDLGCGNGFFSARLKHYYPDAVVVGLDLAYQMLRQSKKRQGWRRKWGLVNADMTALPFRTGLFDLVFSNQVMHWASSLPPLMTELNRVMKPQGCLMFSTLGPDTFRELREAFAKVSRFGHVNEFMDMHDVGDSLLAHDFLEPVMDMEMLTAHYESLPVLLNGLKAQGSTNINPARSQGLTGRGLFQRLNDAFLPYCTSSGRYPLTYEVVYGHAWKGAQRRLKNGVETVFSLDEMKSKIKAAR